MNASPAIHSTPDALTIYRGSDGEATKELYRRLESKGPLGLISLNLFRAAKC
jgi:hypothetical protein